MNLSDIRSLFDYTEWANGLAMESAGKLSDEHLRLNVNISHQSIFGTLTHMAGAEWIWLERWHGRSPAKAEAWLMWTTESCGDLGVLNDRWQGVIDRRSQLISELDEDRLAAELAFKLLSGDPSSMRLVDQMQHVANHATMHRGQVVGMIRQLGIEPPSTDLLFYLRRGDFTEIIKWHRLQSVIFLGEESTGLTRLTRWKGLKRLPRK
jgi:uncharacterized damage-inducible protein DinB